MNSKVQALRQNRSVAIEAANALVTTAEGEGRGLTADEKVSYEGSMREAHEMKERIERLEEHEGLSRELNAPQSNVPDPTTVGLDHEEVKRYSLIRAIRAATTGDWRGAELEREASEAIAEKLGRSPQGFFVPNEVQKRGLSVGVGTAGGDLVELDLLSASFIEMLNNKMVVRQAGATVLTGLVGNILIPRQTGGATAYWVAEGVAPATSQQAVDQVALTPKTVGAFTDISRKLLEQSSIDVEGFVRNDLATRLALAIDYASLHGDPAVNAGQPRGIAATTGIGSVGAVADGSAPTWAEMVALETSLAAANADIDNLHYVTNAKVRGKEKGTQRVAGTDSRMIWDDNNTPINGYSAYVSNQVRSDLTKGLGTNLSAIFFGDWSDLIIGEWGVLDVLVDPYTGGTAGTVRVIALQDVDVAVRHAQSFAAKLDAITV